MIAIARNLFDEGGATFSPCRSWRYTLWRELNDGPTLVVIGLNPSTADERKNDPTCERCMRRAQMLGYGKYVMLNLFAWRATDPGDMKAAPDPVGPQNDETLVRETAGCDVLLAWGVHGNHRGRDEQVLSLIRGGAGRLLCLGKTRSGHPRHPLYVSYDQALELWV